MHTLHSQEVLSGAELYFLACCFYNLPSLKIKSLPLPCPSQQASDSFLPTPQVTEALGLPPSQTPRVQRAALTTSRCWIWGPIWLWPGPVAAPSSSSSHVPHLYPEGPPLGRQTHR